MSRDIQTNDSIIVHVLKKICRHPYTSLFGEVFSEGLVKRGQNIVMEKLVVHKLKICMKTH